MDTHPMRALSGVFANGSTIIWPVTEVPRSNPQSTLPGAAGKIKSCRLAITLAKCESTG